MSHRIPFQKPYANAQDFGSSGLVAASGLSGGILSSITGGDFAQGAITGAYGMIFNEMMHFPSFSKLLKNYPHDQIINGKRVHAHPSKDDYKNQCAIRLGYAMQKSGISLKSYPIFNKTTEGYPRSSKGLADWIWKKFGRPIIYNDIEQFVNSESLNKGIMFELAAPGGISHIDLWNKGDTGSGFYQAEKIWFWEIK